MDNCGGGDQAPGHSVCEGWDRNPVILGKQILLKSAAGKAEGMAVLGCVLPISEADGLYKPSCSDKNHL